MADDEWSTDAAELQELAAALTAAPGDPRASAWRFELFMGYCERADTDGDPADLQRAIRWGNELLDDPALDEADRPGLTYLFMEVVWEEYQLWVRDYGDDPDALDDLVFLISTRTLETGMDEDSVLTRLMTGLAHLERYRETDQRDDLDLGIGYVAQALPLLPPETERWVHAGVALTNAYRRRWFTEDGAASIQLAVATGETTLAWVEASGTDPSVLYVDLARAYKSRWGEENRPADLDRTIDCWREASKVHGPHSWITGEFGDNLRERATAHEDLAELDEAIALLEEAATDGDPDHLCSLGQAHHTRWDLAPTSGGLATALDYFDRALAVGMQDDLLGMAVHRNRVATGCSLLVEDRATVPRQRRNLVEAFDALMNTAELPDGALEDHAALLALGELCLWASGEGVSEDISRLRSLLDMVTEEVDPIPEWGMFRDLLEFVAQINLQVGHVDATADLGVTALSRVVLSPYLDAEMRAFVQKALPVALISRAGRTGDLRGLRAATRALGAWPAPEDDDPRARRDLTESLAMFKFMIISGHSWSGDMAAVGKVLDEILAEVQLDEFTDPFLRMMVELFKVLAGGPAPDRSVFAPVPTMTGENAVMPAFIAAQVDLAVGMRENDPAALRRCGAEFISLAGRPDVHEVVRISMLAVAAYAEILLARLGPYPDAAARAAAHVTAAVEMAGDGHHHLTSTWLMWQAEALRLTDPAGLPGSREVGLRALRAQAWHVLTQSGTDYAVESARSAAANALVVARWCIADGDYASAVTALDAGRGLMLWSATSSRQIADRLTAVGRSDLAAEWLETQGLGRDQVTGRQFDEAGSGTGDVPDDLRQRVVRALLAAPGSPLDAVPLATVRAALSTVEADALVLLVPGDNDHAGTALVVGATGEPIALALPHLQVGDGSPVAGYIHAGDAPPATDNERDARPVYDGTGADLDAVCRWAWTAAMEDVLAYTKQPGRPARLVLMPIGALGRVPWHAARHGDRHAVHDAVFSYNVSVRMFCETATHPLRDIQSALIVGNPEGNLPFAGIEARAVHRKFYPDGTYYGAGAAQPGTPEEVLAWIGSAAAGPSVLSFACHGWADPAAPADAHLVLAGGTLPARKLLAASRLAALVVDRVFLAACATNAAGDDYDEACSLASAFLAAGAHTVFGSLWPVPDRSTSVLMFMIHHFLQVYRCGPADALHRTQLWMLDPDRRPPRDMPTELLDACGRPEVADPASWAAFTHQGR